jgi:HAD superfamily hydrolase (TIGR01509 family)
MFDAVVISGEVGMRKPEHRIYEFTLAQLDMPAPASIFVDDIFHNIKAAAEVGMAGIHHTSYETTKTELSTLLNLNLD